jgi:hypothetical protein
MLQIEPLGLMEGEVQNRVNMLFLATRTTIFETMTTVAIGKG